MLCELVGLFWHCVSLSIKKLQSGRLKLKELQSQSLGLGLLNVYFTFWLRLFMLGRPRKRERASSN